jgi:hypothetical protein
VTDIKDRIRETLSQSRLHKDFLTLTNELLKNRTLESVELANKIISDEVEGLAQEISALMEIN